MTDGCLLDKLFLFNELSVWQLVLWLLSSSHFVILMFSISLYLDDVEYKLG